MKQRGVAGTVMVGVRADTESQALFTWVLVNVAAARDCTVFVHVVLASTAAAVDFDAMLGIYEGFCNLKQINLTVKICKGSSVHKGKPNFAAQDYLGTETELEEATWLFLLNFVLGGSIHSSASREAYIIHRGYELLLFCVFSIFGDFVAEKKLIHCKRRSIQLLLRLDYLHLNGII